MKYATALPSEASLRFVVKEVRDDRVTIACITEGDWWALPFAPLETVSVNDVVAVETR